MGRSGVGIAGSNGATLAEVATTTPGSSAPGLVVRVAGGTSVTGAVTIADGADVALGTTTDVAWVSGAGTVIALLKKLISQLGSALTVTFSTPTAIVNGAKKVAITHTAVQLTSGACTGAIISANSTNSASVFLGTATVTDDYNASTSGVELQPGQSVGVAIDNLNRLYVNGTANDGVNWLAS